MLETHHPAFSCPICRTFANLEDDVEVDAISFELEDDRAEKESPAPVSAPEDADMLLLSPNMGRERDGAETEVEPDMGFGNGLRRFPVPPSIIDLAEGSDDDRDALMADALNHDNEPPLPPLPEGEGLVPPPPPERELPGARSASVSDAEDGSGESSQGIGEADRAAKRKR
jgi:E3 ubiquitin-protein ligase DMA1/2